jgi:putative tricarboxylic transport membrane protein
VTAMDTAPGAGEARARPARPGRRVGVRTVFFALLLVVLAGYLQMALGMEWRTQAGRIGPAFFPRIIGVLGLALTLVALLQSLRPAVVEADRAGDGAEDAASIDDEAGAADLGRHPRTMAIVIAASAAFTAAFTVLGAVVAAALYLLGCLLNRDRPVLNVVVSLGLSLGLYLLFETVLDVGLPAGVLPL